MVTLNIFKRGAQSGANRWFSRPSEDGIHVSSQEESGAVPLKEPTVRGYLSQLFDDGFASQNEGAYFVSWPSFYEALAAPAYAELPQLFGLPPFATARPRLQSRDALTDETFSIALSGWTLPSGETTLGTLTGPLLQLKKETFLVTPPSWALLQEVDEFFRRTARDEITHRQAWGRIRRLAIAADAHLDDFLYRSVVLTPERLDLVLRRSDAVADDRVVEIEPVFEGAPADWLSEFDRESGVRDRYSIVTPEGIVQVLISPKVRTVLQEIKRMPFRRVAGSRAQAFIVNPYALLGDDAVDVIEETQFERAREEAGLNYDRFSPAINRTSDGYPTKVGLLVETANASGPMSSETLWLSDSELVAFVEALSRALNNEHQLLAWEGYDFLLDGSAAQYLKDLKEAYERRQTPPTLIFYAQVHDLSGYSSRIEGIGVEKPYYSPYIAKRKEEDGWFPENVLPVVMYKAGEKDEPIAVPTSKPVIEGLKRSIAEAEQGREAEVKVSWLPTPIKVAEAKQIVETFTEVFKDLDTYQCVDPNKYAKPPTAPAATRKQLVLRANIQTIEYEEQRREALLSVPTAPRLPKALRPQYQLLEHQMVGVAWLQHLYSLQADYHVRGAVLADDMGLGKTFQLLTFMASLVEQNHDIAPMLIVAPVSLLENWAQEIEKFLSPKALPVLTAYGDALAGLRVPRSLIDQRLVAEDGLVKFLRPDWRGDAKLVLTTYETLRDLEFSFAAVKWSVMVCDEAQRIKNPAAMVTRAAKKQNVDFKIACTGTPVENTLADLWCLFDFVQAGLLGALNDFGQRYRRPIEASTDDEKARVGELRQKIAPQILRRMKDRVARDLPEKIEVSDCRNLSISAAQRNLYARAVEQFKRREDPTSGSPFKNHLGLLHYLRLVCTNPVKHGQSVFKPEHLHIYREKSPKMDWLLKQLADIKKAREKVIVFCEFREIQRLLQHYIEEEFGLRVDIINGDTSASSTHVASRQKRIKAFQEAPGFGVLILSPVAVGFGVNIQAANHVVHYTRTWNPAKEDQATDRAYRIGQTKPVYVYYPVVRAQDFTTFDEKLDQLLTEKRRIARDMLNGSGDIKPGEFKVADVVPAADLDGIDERVTLDAALRMDAAHFEGLVAVLWTKEGYSSYRTPSSGDSGVDVVALRGDEGVLIQAKTSGKEGATLSWEAVKDVVTGEAYYRQRHRNVKFKKVCLTNQFFNHHAQEQALLNRVELLDQNALAKLLKKHDVMILEVEQILGASWEAETFEA